MNDKSWGGIQGIVEHAINRASDSTSYQVENLAKTVVANIASSTQRGKEPALLAEDGATFHASIQHAPGGQFQATCHAELEAGSSLKMESPIYGIFSSKRDAHIWVHQHATERKFASVFWADEFSAKAV